MAQQQEEEQKQQVKFHYNKHDGSLTITFLDKNYSLLQRLKYVLTYLFSSKSRNKDFVVAPKDVDLLVKIAFRTKILKQKAK